MTQLRAAQHVNHSKGNSLGAKHTHLMAFAMNKKWK